MAKKYLVVPGYVFSENDGDRHYIDAPKLMRLYNVDPAECVVIPRIAATDIYFRLYPDLEVLTPKHNGDYKCSTAPESL